MSSRVLSLSWRDANSTEISSISPEPCLVFFLCWFATTAIFSALGFGFLAYVSVLIHSAVRSFRRPVDGLWLVLLSFAVAVMSIRLDYTGEFGGDAPKAYLYWGLSIVCVGAAMFAGSFVKARHFPSEKRLGLKSIPLFILFLIIAVSVSYGLTQGNSIGLILRQSSGLGFLLCFISIGRRIRATSREFAGALANIRLLLIAYSVVYLIHVVYENFAMRLDLPEGDFLRERSPILFFCGLFAALEFGRWLFHGFSSAKWRNWGSLILLALSAILSGSRSIVASMVATSTLLLLVRYVSRPLRAALMLCLAIVGIMYLRPQDAVLQFSGQYPVFQHIAKRFLVAPEEDFSFLQRSSQMMSLWDGFKSKPLLGGGMGATLIWFDPYSLQYVETGFVDSGIGYLLLKMGALGLIGFSIFLLSLFWTSWVLWKTTNGPIMLATLAILAYYLAFLPFGPSFFQFLFCFWVGLVIGNLYFTAATSASQSKVRNSLKTVRL